MATVIKNYRHPYEVRTADYIHTLSGGTIQGAWVFHSSHATQAEAESVADDNAGAYPYVQVVEVDQNTGA